jgi:hypothetical protein
MEVFGLFGSFGVMFSNHFTTKISQKLKLKVSIKVVFIFLGKCL